MADYIKRDYEGQEIDMPGDYVKLEIESCDPSHIYFKYNTGYTGTNITKTWKDGFAYFTGLNQNNNFTLNTNYNILASGDYRVEVFCFTTTRSEKVSLKINNKTIGTTQSLWAKDVFMRRVDFGIVRNLPEGNTPIVVNCGGHAGVIAVYMKKVRETFGDSENNGILTIKNAKGTVGNPKQPDTLEVTIKNEPGIYSEGGFKELKNKTGLIFAYRDAVNFTIKNTDGKLQQVFGGYISSPLLNDEGTSISIACAGRLKDAELRRSLKQITVGGATSDVTTLTYNAKDFYDALSYLCQSVELPIKVGNLDKIAQAIPNRTGYHVNYASIDAKNKLATKNMLKTIHKSAVTLRNYYKKKTEQRGVLWDSSWNKKGEAQGYKITNTPVFFIKYGLGPAPSDKKMKVWVPKQYTKTHKLKKNTGKYVTKKGTVGYDSSKPLQAYIEIQYSMGPSKSAARETVTIDFTITDNSIRKIGAISPILKNNTAKQGELNIINLLRAKHPTGDFYLRRISLYSPASTSDLYDPKTEKSSYQMDIYSAGFREGVVVAPEVMQSSGQKVSDSIYSIQEDIGSNIYMIYAKDRSDDKLMLVKDEAEVNLIEFVEGPGGNVLGISNLQYSPVSELINSIIKVYKTSDTTNNYVTSKEVASIFRFSEHQDLEVLNDDVGAFYASYLAMKDVDKNIDPGHTYSLPIGGYPDVHVGQLAISTLNNEVYNDCQTIESLEYEYDPGQRPMVQSTVGFGEMNPDLKADLNMVGLRKAIKTKRTAFAGGATEEEHIDLI
jgi:hypothetical protein